ncbi:cytochrome P450 [Phanerochaete sordida]|uniref:Cytochrome P450 n=1 Tax=Phanerochaete sordida TaxID=48140 RepID=A0A9P3GNC4_9APHY|nr:cytochrome P450 [Phanerochaete sordida]
MSIASLLQGWTVREAVFVSLLTSTGYATACAIYNLYFHPLAKYPGPRLAAATRWWKAYIELVQGESINNRLFGLHEEYGDVVRMAPNELHFSDPAVYNEIYSPRSRWNKDETVYAPFGKDSSMFNTYDYRGAKRRRDLAAPHFSRKSVVNLQQYVQEGIDELCEVMAERAKEGKPSDIFRAWRCLDFDNVTSFCFGWSLHAVRESDFHAPAVEEMLQAGKDYMFWKHFSFLRALLPPPQVIWLLLNQLLKNRPYFKMILKLKEQVETYMAEPAELANAPHAVVFDALLNPAQSMKLTKGGVIEESNLFVVAGTDTTSNASAIGTMYALGGDGHIAKQLQAELRAAWPRLDEKPTLEVLETLPYLRAVCKESLRLSHGVISIMLRVVPPQGATLGGHFVPGGAKVGISNAMVHLNPTLFPDPHAFRPERWLEPGAELLDTWLVAFSKGPRSCLGINLAWCELQMNLANLFRRFDLELEGEKMHEMFAGKSPARPYDLWRDCFLPVYEGPDMLVRATPVAD